MNISYKTAKNISADQLHVLYTDANWTAYTKDMDNLVKAVQHSLEVITAWHEDSLIGLIRVVGDGHTILYVQDILIKKAYKRNGIGKEMVQRVLANYPNIRQIVLMTDDNEETRGFYEAIGFESCDKGTLVAFAKMQF